ncbi:hypothetical protein KOJCDNHJ_01371 [Xanthomonas citri pv. punicae]|nr:hypothetical protein FICKIIDM_02600 [Xanthomonas citri pv. punicae]UIS27977.1 hypothetical protein KOJCDNHJ_01371 [Xanthomonas citri pv. punicae]
MKLDDLGPRICILGPSNSGKSTLAQAIAQARGCVPVHLDQLHHLPNTAWIPRPDRTSWRFTAPQSPRNVG